MRGLYRRREAGGTEGAAHRLAGGHEKRGKLKAAPEDSVLGQLLRKPESLKASIRSKVEHPFHIVKNLFHFRKVRYKGLAKNTAQLHTLFGLANLVIAKRQLLALHSQGAS